MSRPRLKTYTGCLKCRARRKKCDEQRPRCAACLKWNFTCTWPSLSHSSEHSEQSTASEQSQSLVTQHHPEPDERFWREDAPEFPTFRHGPSWDNEERQAFDFFRSQTSNDMSGVFRMGRETDVWSFMLPRGAQQDAAIKHAVCALGALHRHLSYEPDNTQDRIYLLAAEQYNRAVRCTIRSTRHDRTSIDAVLVMCILFTLLESQLGDTQTAMSHLRAGMLLLPRLNQKSSRDEEATHIPRPMIVAMLKRLERQLYELGQPRVELGSAQISLVDLDVPTAFESLEDAVTTFETYFNDSCFMMNTCEWKQDKQCQVQKPVEPDLVFLLHRVLTKWTESFKAFLQNTRLLGVFLSTSDQMIVHTLHLWRLVLSVSLVHYQTGDEMVCDKFLPEFAEAVSHCAAVVSAQQRVPKTVYARGQQTRGENFNLPSNTSPEGDLSSQPPVSFDHPRPGTSLQFSFDRPSRPVLTFSPFSPLPALFTIAFRCRDPKIRRRAIQLLRDIDWCDAFWDSKISYKFAERLMQIEENGYLAGHEYTGDSRSIDSAQQILPTARCRQVRAKFEKPRTFIFDYISINANEWVPSPQDREDSGHDSFWETGMIREKWVVVAQGGKSDRTG